MEPHDVSDRSRGVALALAAVVGMFGGHRFYVGKIGTGLAMIFTLGGLGIWWLYDLIVVAAGSFRDAEGRRVWRWTEPESSGAAAPARLTPEQIEQILAEVDGVRAEVADLAERVEFMERMLTRARNADQLEPGERL